MKGRGQLLFEIGCEEIPAGMIRRAAEELKAILVKHLTTTGLVDEPTAEASVETFGAPRRLSAIAKNVRVKQEDVTREVMGPPKSIALDAEGKPTRAGISFAEKQGIPFEKVGIVTTPKGEYLVARQAVVGQPATKILGEVLPQAIREISWPRSMTWSGLQSPRFIRPIRWIVAMLDNKVIPCQFADVTSGNRTDGHRFLGSRTISLGKPADYEAKLRKSFVLCRPEARRKKIETEIRTISSRKSVRIHEDAALLDLVTYLNEYPTVIMGSFDPSYLELPEEILITVMRDHQKYFAVEDKRGELTPNFLAVINLSSDPKGLVRAGHERVLRARFADARFFWETDQKTKLGDFLPKLSAVTYERRLGSYGEKVIRMRSLSRWFAEQWFSGGITQADVAGADRAAELAKCDLISEMVREFTELQGVVGGLYAEVQGEPEEIADAVYDQYKPVGLDDPIPRNLTGCAVSLADKLDSLVACFAVGAIPTGSSDPFALRRAALGIAKIILERRLPVPISAAISAAAKSLREQANPKVETTPQVEKQIHEFLLERAKFILRERMGFAYDEINAAVAAGDDDLVDVLDRVTALHAIRTTNNFAPLAASFKRIRNIFEKSVQSGEKAQAGVNESLLQDAAEKELHKSALKIGAEALTLKKDRKYRPALEKISELRPAVDQFFDKVLVMAEDVDVRKNRIALLGGLLKEFSTIADFSLLATDEAKRP